jgi:hypothetical protein
MPANPHPRPTEITGANNSHTAVVLHGASGSDADKRAMQAPSVDQDQVRAAAICGAGPDAIETLPRLSGPARQPWHATPLLRRRRS